ncbi:MULTISPECIES: hypothetical protein [unclassified Mucilaginibacter]|uniref:hypothetical protein n=1 Tax=unclassified Mucilaginibacter TaxID=2617802 RepID=UPI000AE2DA89|nr:MULTISPECIES: hypothetical protein [unclassified Mucilaginibacter]HEK22113.1 hypothetical protein [Bacteroidota bacterium]
MTWTNVLNLMQDIHFRKMFFLMVFITAAILIFLKYKLLPYFNRWESPGYRLLRWVLDALILITFAVIAIAAVAFWMSGNR